MSLNDYRYVYDLLLHSTQRLRGSMATLKRPLPIERAVYEAPQSHTCTPGEEPKPPKPLNGLRAYGFKV